MFLVPHCSRGRQICHSPTATHTPPPFRTAAASRILLISCLCCRAKGRKTWGDEEVRKLPALYSKTSPSSQRIPFDASVTFHFSPRLPVLVCDTTFPTKMYWLALTPMRKQVFANIRETLLSCSRALILFRLPGWGLPSEKLCT
jgi:hypothetical protein